MYTVTPVKGIPGCCLQIIILPQSDPGDTKLSGRQLVVMDANL